MTPQEAVSSKELWFHLCNDSQQRFPLAKMSDSSFEAPSPEQLAELLPQYEIAAFIAQGGMGAVYAGRQRSLDRDIAIKVLPREFGDDPEFRESFTTEAKAMARLNHPNLIGVFDHGDVDGMPYIVMEYVPGCSLHESAWNQAIEPAQAVAIVKGICDGLAHAHEHGIVHRDIKPANILLTLKAEPKIGDFGLANAADSDTPGLIMGTPGYTAPEIFQDPNQAGPLADLYSVGVIFHQLLTGIDPAGSQGPPTRVTGNIRLDAIWRKATHLDPAQRYPSVAAMGEELAKWSAAKPGTPVAPAAVGAMPSMAPRRPAVQVNTGGGGGGGVMVKLLIIGVLVAVVVFTYQLLQEYKEDIKGGIADARGVSQDEPSEPSPEPEPEPVVIDEPEEIIEPEPEPIPKPEIVENDASEEPEPPPIADTEPEPDPEPHGDLTPGDPELLERAIGLIEDARKKRDKALADNARSLVFDLDVSSRGAKQDEVDFIARLKEDIVDGLIPITSELVGLPEEIERKFEHAREKEASIMGSCRTDLSRIRDAYMARLNDAAGKSEDEDLKRRLLTQSAEAEDLDAWVMSLAPESDRVPKKSTGYYGLDGIIGKWCVHNNQHTERWVSHRDGRVEFIGTPWEMTWEIVAGGTLEVTLPDSRKFTLTRDGEDWAGLNPFGAPARLTPGDW